MLRIVSLPPSECLITFTRPCATNTSQRAGSPSKKRYSSFWCCLRTSCLSTPLRSASDRGAKRALSARRSELFIAGDSNTVQGRRQGYDRIVPQVLDKEQYPRPPGSRVGIGLLATRICGRVGLVAGETSRSETFAEVPHRYQVLRRPHRRLTSQTPPTRISPPSTKPAVTGSSSHRRLKITANIGER